MSRCSVEFIDNTLGRDDGRLMSRYRDNEVKYNAHAEDYAFYTWGLLELHAATRDTKYLKRALQLTDIFLQDFWDEENGGFYFCSKSSKELIANPKPVYDGAMPSANSVSALNLLRLAVLTGKISSVNMPTGYFRLFCRCCKQPAYIFNVW